ncbi:hypothetical protein P879_09624 [Paragonimus westermani]|uniref:Uncharacterized protein n=1 Tax=Paragonimus westermani TaxID=34504 RepID=A0A8T0DP49_9TREM|nr:hypothetical protein P879_09624 [Paragonimus westermani]
MNERAESVMSDHPPGKTLFDSMSHPSTSLAEPRCHVSEQACNKVLEIESLPDRADNTKPTDSLPRIRAGHRRDSGSISEPGNLTICKRLPSGDKAMDCRRFIQSFMSGFDRYTDDFANRSSYLIQYCDDEAPDVIIRCAVLEPELGHN